MLKISVEMREFNPDGDLRNGFREALGALSPATAHAEAIIRSEFVRKRSNCHTFVCVEAGPGAGRVIGTVSVLLESKLSRECRYVAHVEDVAVAPDRQGLGVGAFMVRFAEDFARLRGARSVVLHCTPEVAGFYRELGFEETGVAMGKIING